MAGSEESPKSFPQTTPPDLYATSDIRFVMLELGKLTAKVDRLIDDVRSQGEKLDQVRQQISFVRGAMWIIGGLIAAAVAVGSWYLRMQFR